MSRLAKQPLEIPQGVTVTFDGGVLTVKGPKGTLTRSFDDTIAISIADNHITLVPSNLDDVYVRSLWGTYASHIRNMIKGVMGGFEKKLILEGVGFKSAVSGKNLEFALGFSHPVKVPVPEGITATADKNIITISGIDKELVGSFSAYVRSLKKPEPYKGKGFRYEDETIRRKQGKKSV